MMGTLISCLSFKVRFIKNVRSDVIYGIKNSLGIICGIIIFLALVFSKSLIKNEWVSTKQFLIVLNLIKCNEIDVLLCMVTVAFITISVTSIVANKTIIIYWINVVEHDLINSIFNYYVMSCYIFISLLAAIIGVVRSDIIVLGFSFISELFFMTVLCLRVMYVYFGTYYRRLRLEKKYRKQLKNALIALNASKLDYMTTEEIWVTNQVIGYFDDLITNTVLAQNNNDLITKKTNLEFLTQNALFIPNDRLIRLIDEADESIKLSLMLDIIGRFTVFMNGLSIKEDDKFYIFGSYYFYADIRKYRSKLHNYSVDTKQDDVLNLFFCLLDMNHYDDKVISSLKMYGSELGRVIGGGIEAYYNLTFNIFDVFFVKSIDEKTSYGNKAEDFLKKLIENKDIDEDSIEFMFFLRRLRVSILQIMVKMDDENFYKDLYGELVYYSKLFKIVNRYIENTPSLAKQVFLKTGDCSFIEESILKEIKAPNKNKVYKIIN